jgi:general L-amino acid transport system substrate-binding protein
VSGNAAGFSLPDSKGVMRGMDADMCRIVAAAVFGDAAKVKYVPVTPDQRLTALQSGEVDVLAANLTWTMTRETQSGLEFAALEYYDGEGFMVAKKLNVNNAKQLNGASVCMLAGSSEGAAHDYFARIGIKFRPVVFSDGPELRTAFLSGRCDVYQTDASTLANFKASLGAKSNDYVILSELAGKEPLGMAVRKGDDKWFDIVRWSFFATLTAEEAGITSKNVSQSLTSTEPGVRRLLGGDGDLGKSLGLDNRWVYNIISQVGNYGEIWERAFGATGVPRGYNRLWRDGGLMYAPPMR